METNIGIVIALFTFMHKKPIPDTMLEVKAPINKAMELKSPNSLKRPGYTYIYFGKK